MLVYSGPQVRAATLGTAKRVGVDVIRVQFVWRNIALQRLRNASDPLAYGGRPERPARRRHTAAAPAGRRRRWGRRKPVAAATASVQLRRSVAAARLRRADAAATTRHDAAAHRHVVDLQRAEPPAVRLATEAQRHPRHPGCPRRFEPLPASG